MVDLVDMYRSQSKWEESVRYLQELVHQLPEEVKVALRFRAGTLDPMRMDLQDEVIKELLVDGISKLVKRGEEKSA